MERTIGSGTISMKKFFFWCFAASLLFHLLAAWFSIGYQYQDEQSEIMEFAGHKLGIVPAHELSWEFGYQMRQAIQPLIVVGLYKFLALFKLANPFLCSLLLRILSALLGWVSLMFLTKEYLRFIDSVFWKKFAIALACFIWFIPYVQAHFSAESMSGSLFFLGIALFMAFQRISVAGRQNIYLLLGAGAAIGLAFVVRYQTIFLIFGFGLWLIFIAKLPFRNLVKLIIPALLMIALGVFIDHWFYGRWVCTAYNYYYANIALGKLSTFGNTPFYFYFYIYYLNLFPPISIFIMGAIIYSWIKYPKNILTWICMPCFILLSLFGHKETRFFFPIVEAIPIMLILPFQNIKTGFLNKSYIKWPVSILWGLNFLLLIYFSFKPANSAFGLYEYLYKYNNTKGETEIITNDPGLYRMTGNPITIHKPKNVEIVVNKINTMLLRAQLSAARNKLIVINNSQTADSFHKSNPTIPMIYKSFPEAVDYFTWNKEKMNKVWYVFDVSSSISSCRMTPAKQE